MNYRGIGSGIKRAKKEHPNIEFINDRERELFISILNRVTSHELCGSL